VVSVVLLRPVSTYGANTWAGQAVAARAVCALPTVTAVAVATPSASAAAAASDREPVYGASPQAADGL
jgi:hypothetical protein